jgi:hypothetical protein
MSLDLSQAASQVQRLAQHLQASTSQHQQRLSTAMGSFAACAEDGPALEALKEKIARSRGKVTWLVAGLDGPLGERHVPPPAPADYVALATDGSHIDVDRHSPVQCYLINIGKVAIRYGQRPEASLSSTPTLYASPEHLVLRDPAGAGEVPVEGPLVDLKRAVQELEALVDMAEAAREEAPVLALVDGSLVVWPLTGHAHPEFVRDLVLREGYLRSLERAYRLAQRRPFLLASYISYPRSTEVVNALRLTSGLCPYDIADCDDHCGKPGLRQRPCEAIGGTLDRDLFARMLKPGERSTTFASMSSIVQRYYGEHAVSYFYLNVGEEMARIELPGWLAREPEKLDLLHSLVLDQCRRGAGYPVALAEAHEQAVLSPSDHRVFWDMVSNSLETHRVRAVTSAKERSKQSRWL